MNDEWSETRHKVLEGDAGQIAAREMTLRQVYNVPPAEPDPPPVTSSTVNVSWREGSWTALLVTRNVAGIAVIVTLAVLLLTRIVGWLA